MRVKMELTENQSALILDVDENGEITVNVASGDQDTLTSGLCQAIAYKLTNDEDFQEELMSMLEFDE